MFLITTESLHEPLCIVCWIGNIGELFLMKQCSRRLHRDTNKFTFAYKQVSGRNGDHE